MLLKRRGNMVEIIIRGYSCEGMISTRVGTDHQFIHFRNHLYDTNLILNELSRLLGAPIGSHPLFSCVSGYWPYGNVNKQLDFIEELCEFEGTYGILTEEELAVIKKLNTINDGSKITEKWGHCGIFN